MKLDELEQEIKKDSIVDRTDLANESLKIPRIHGKYLSIYRDEKLRMRQLDHKIRSLRKDKWLYYSGKAPADVYKAKPFHHKILRTDLQLFIDADEEVQKINAQLEIQRSIVEYLEAFIAQLNQRHWQIKSAIDFLRFTQGDI